MYSKKVLIKYNHLQHLKKNICSKFFLLNNDRLPYSKIS